MTWINKSWVDIDSNINDLLGFIYRIDLEGGKYYYGRKQFWSKRGSYWYESDWRTYQSSSNTILSNPESILQKSILAVFESKSAIRYAEALAIILSGAYEDRDRGINWSFAGCKGTLKLSDRDKEQLERLRTMVGDWRINWTHWEIKSSE